MTSIFAKMTTKQIHIALAASFYGMAIFLSLGVVSALVTGFGMMNIPSWMIMTSVGIGTLSMISCFVVLIFSSKE